MLTLTRNPGERILIGDDIAVTYLSSRERDGSIRVLIQAPGLPRLHMRRRTLRVGGKWLSITYQIQIRALEQRDAQVRFSVVAPIDVAVDREEVRIQKRGA